MASSLRAAATKQLLYTALNVPLWHLSRPPLGCNPKMHSHRKSLHHCWLHLQCEHPEHDALFDSGTATCGERLGGGAK